MKLKDQIIAISEMMGSRLSDAAGIMMVGALSQYPIESVRVALGRAQTECRSLTLANILERIPGAAPGADEAWAICSGAWDERTTFVATDAMMKAWGDVRHMEDKIAARMAFKEIYPRYASENPMPKWTPSFGHDPNARLAPVKEAILKGRLPESAVENVRHLGEGQQDQERKALPAPGEKMKASEVSAEVAAIMKKLNPGK